MMFVLYCDRKYFRWAPVLIESIGISEPEESVCVYGIDLTEQQIEVLESYNAHYFEYSVDDRPVFSFEKRSRKFTDVNRFKITNSKADFLLKSFEAFPRESLFMVMDVDCLLIRPLDELKKKMRRHDLAGLMKGRRIACGFKAVNLTDVSKRMIKDWNDFLLDGHYYYNKDQLSFMEFYRKHEDEMKFLNLDQRYIDPQSKDDSYIWSAHKARFGSKDERFELYKKKLEKLRVERVLIKYNPEKYWDERAKNLKAVGGGIRKRPLECLSLEFETLFQWYCFYFPDSVLDVGCAEGRVLQGFRRKGIELDMTMCDISDEYRRRCFRETGMLPDRCDGRVLPYPDESFGLVISASVLLHVASSLVDEVWSEHVRVARKYLYVSTDIKRCMDVEGYFYHDYLRLFEESRLDVKEEMKFGKRRASWWLKKKTGNS